MNPRSRQPRGRGAKRTGVLVADTVRIDGGRATARGTRET